MTLVPHTHWDREWYLPFEEFREHLVSMMAGLLDLLDDGFPHFHLDGQAAMVDDYLEVRPDQEDRIQALVREGRLSVGPWYTQMDEFLVSGESLIRNLEWGRRRAVELGDKRPVGYLPDQFGHVGQMPQILARAGIDRAVVWRGVPSAIDRTSFWWESPDGSRVLTEYLPFGYSIGMHLRHRETPGDLAGALRDAASWLEPMNVREQYLVTAGSDHHGPDPTLPERLRDAAHLAPELDVQIGSIADHVAPPAPGDVPLWQGELRAAARAHLLPGVYSTRAHQKRERARVEALVERYAEPLAALVPGFAWPAERLERAWRLLLWNGAHDSVCGCSVDEVARAVDARHEEARAIAEGIVRDASEALSRRVKGSGVLRFNPSPFEREGVAGLGWRVDAEPFEPEGTPVEVAVDGDAIRAGDTRMRLLDEPDVGDLYNFCPEAQTEPDGPRRLSVQGSKVVATFDRLEVELRFTRRSDEPFLRVDGTIRNERGDHRLRLHVGLPDSAAHVVAGAPFELVERGLVSEGSDLEAASSTWPARGVVLAGGLAMLSEGVVEYEVVDGREIAITLLRCVGTISRPHLATRPMAAGPDMPTPEAQMTGETSFALAVYPGAVPDTVLAAWERFALPVLSVPATGEGGLATEGRLLEIEAEALSSVRRVSGGGLEVRVWNPRRVEAKAIVGDGTEALGPAEIRTVRLPDPAGTG